MDSLAARCPSKKDVDGFTGYNTELLLMRPPARFTTEKVQMPAELLPFGIS